MYDNYVVASHTDTDILMCHIYIFMHTHSAGPWPDTSYLSSVSTGVKDCPHRPLRGRIYVYPSLFSTTSTRLLSRLVGLMDHPESCMCGIYYIYSYIYNI